MIRSCLFVVIGAASLAACSFNAPGVIAGDAAVGDDEDAATPGDPPPDGDGIAACDTPDARGLVLCLELEDGVDDGVLVDSSPGHHDATTAGLAPATRLTARSAGAAIVGPDATTRVGEAADLDRDAAYTFAMWIRPDVAPAVGEAQGLLDHEHQYAMLIGHRGAPDTLEVRCAHTDLDELADTEDLPVGAWSLVACTWDGAELCAVRWTSPRDRQRSCHAALAPQPTGAAGLAIGHLSEDGEAHSRFDGALDSVQVFDRALTAAELCAIAGQPAGCLP